MNYNARSANAAEQTALISYYQAKVDFWQAFATIWAFIAAAMAVWFAKRAADETASAAASAAQALVVAQETHAAENRPWVQIDNLRIAGDMAFHAGQSAISASFDMINKGNVPAIDILRHWKVMPDARQMEIAEQIDLLIAAYDNLKKSSIARRVPEQILFPEQPRKDRRVEMDFRVADIANRFGSDKWIISALAILVVCYKSPHDNKIKYSVCTYTLHIDGAAYVVDDIENIPMIDRIRLELTPWFNGWTAG